MLLLFSDFCLRYHSHGRRVHRPHAYLDFAIPVGISTPSARTEIISYLTSSSHQLGSIDFPHTSPHYTFSTNFVLVRRSSLERRRKLGAKAGGLGFVPMHDGVFMQRIQLLLACAGLPSSVRLCFGQPCSPFEAGALPVLRPARRIHIRLRGRVLCNPPRLKGFRPARPYETAVLFQNLVSVGFPLGLRPRPSKRYAFFGG